jgi:uncharacterized protein YceK
MSDLKELSGFKVNWSYHKMKKILFYIIVVYFLTSGCSAVKETSKHQLQTGIYKVNTYMSETFYASVKDDTIDL